VKDLKPKQILFASAFLCLFGGDVMNYVCTVLLWNLFWSAIQFPYISIHIGRILLISKIRYSGTHHFALLRIVKYRI